MISFMAKRRRKKAGMKAQAAPASTAPTAMPGIMIQAGAWGKSRTMPVAPMAPMMYWPSAPMFQIRIRKHTATPVAHKKMGMVLSSVSSRL